MKPGVYRYLDIEHRRTNDYGRPISVVTLETEETGVKMYYAPSIIVLESEKPTKNKFYQI